MLQTVCPMKLRITGPLQKKLPAPVISNLFIVVSLWFYFPSLECKLHKRQRCLFCSLSYPNYQKQWLAYNSCSLNIWIRLKKHTWIFIKMNNFQSNDSYYLLGTNLISQQLCEVQVVLLFPFNTEKKLRHWWKIACPELLSLIDK